MRHHLLLLLGLVRAHVALVRIEGGVAVRLLMHAHPVAIVLHVWCAVLMRSIRPSVIVELLLSVVTAVVALAAKLTCTWVLRELLLHWECLQQLCDLEVEFITTCNIIPLGRVIVELLESLEAKLVFGLFVDDITVLLQLVVADRKLPVTYQSVVETLEGLLSLIRCLEADKGVCLFLLV